MSEEKQVYGRISGYGHGFSDARDLAKALTWLADFAGREFGENTKVMVSGSRFEPIPAGTFGYVHLGTEPAIGPDGEKFVVLEISNA
jgi:hypothetical protein